MQPIVLCLDATKAPRGWGCTDWPRVAASRRIPLVARSVAGEAIELFARAMDEIAPRAVVFAGLHSSEHLVYCRARGFRTILLIDDEDAGALLLALWNEGERGSPFHAHAVLAVGRRAPEPIVDSEGAALTIEFVPAYSPAEQFQWVEQRIDELPDERDQVPAALSTRVRLVEQIQLRAAIARGDRREELLLVRRLARAWCGEGGLPTPEEPELSARPARVLFISHDLSKTGAPLALAWALRALKARPHGLDLWAMGIGDGPMEEVFREIVGDRFRIAYCAESDHPWTPVLDAIAEIAPDVVFLNGSPLYPLATLLAWKGQAALWWYHEGLNLKKRDGHLFTRRSLEFLVRHALGWPGGVLTASMDTVRELEGLSRALVGRVRNVPYGFEVQELVAKGDALRKAAVTTRAECGIPRDAIVFVCVGSLERRKNFHRLVLAFQDFVSSKEPSERSNYHLVSIGNLDPDRCAPNNYHAECVALIRPEWAAQIHILGPKPSAWPWMAAADAQVLVSTNECSPLVNLESILLGTIVISSRVHGIPEVIADGERGYLVEPEDVDSIRGGLERFDRTRRSEPQALDRMRIAALDYVARVHDLRVLGETIEREIEHLLHLKAIASAAPPLSRSTHDYLGMQLNLRWALAKHDATNERHMLRAHTHHLYEAEAQG